MIGSVELERDFSSIKTREYGEYVKKSISTSKFDSGEYYNSDKSNWKQLNESLVRSVFTVSREQDFSKSFFINFEDEFEKYVSKYIGSHDYRQIGDHVIVKAKTFKHLLTTQDAIEHAIDSIVEETAIKRVNDPLIYNLSEVMEKLEFDEDDLKDILTLLEDEEF